MTKSQLIGLRVKQNGELNYMEPIILMPLRVSEASHD